MRRPVRETKEMDHVLLSLRSVTPYWRERNLSNSRILVLLPVDEVVSIGRRNTQVEPHLHWGKKGQIAG